MRTVEFGRLTLGDGALVRLVVGSDDSGPNRRHGSRPISQASVVDGYARTGSN